MRSEAQAQSLSVRGLPLHESRETSFARQLPGACAPPCVNNGIIEAISIALRNRPRNRIASFSLVRGYSFAARDRISAAACASARIVSSTFENVATLLLPLTTYGFTTSTVASLAPDAFGFGSMCRTVKTHNGIDSNPLCCKCRYESYVRVACMPTAGARKSAIQHTVRRTGSHR